jgi:hypothetical protein
MFEDTLAFRAIPMELLIIPKRLYPKALCLCNFAEPPPPGLSKRGMTSVMPFYADVKVILPLIVATVALVAAAVIVAFRWKNREFSSTFESRKI